ncbi:chalcone-flavanone isomerase [Seiridium cupressi]
MQSARPLVHSGALRRSLPKTSHSGLSRLPQCLHAPAQTRTFMRRSQTSHRAQETLNLDRMRTDSYSYHVKRQRFLAAGSVAGMLAFTYTAYLLWKEVSKPSKFDSGLPSSADPFLTEAGSKRKTVVHDQDGQEMVPTGNSTVQWFPRILELDAGAADGQEAKNGVEYTLVGQGTRTVTFLGFEVYVVGYYVATHDIAAIQSKLVKEINPIATTLVPSERDELKRRLLDPVEGEKLWLDILLDVKPRSAIRIIPVRNTDFPHLRDGFVRAITARSQAHKEEYNDEVFGIAMTGFKNLFNRGKVAAKAELIMVRDENGTLTILHDGGKQQKPKEKNENSRVAIGHVADERVSRALWLNYLAGKAVASEPARKNIVEGIMEFVERPVGTVAAQVV